MNIHQIAYRLNEKAVEEEFQIATLPELRKKYLGKKTLPYKIFTEKTIFDEEDKYAFHHGGRDEMQFNVGGEDGDAVHDWSRFGLCFSLRPSQSLKEPIRDLEPFRKRFNQCMESHPEYFEGFEMWYYQNGQRSNNFSPTTISSELFQLDTFICLGKLIKKPLSNLDEKDFTEILEGFDELLPIYEYTVLNNLMAVEKLKIFTRLTSNDNNWELPSPHRWKKSNQGKKNIPFENQYGFGHEEWLFNPRFNLKGFQYGFIRGVQRSKESISQYSEIHLYTVKKEQSRNLVYYLGHIENVIVIKDDPNEQKFIQKVIDQYTVDMHNEVQEINADVSGIKLHPFKAMVKFKLDNVKFFDEPVLQPDFQLGKYKRFQPYEFEGSIEDIFDLPDEDAVTGFVSGKASQTTVYNRKNRESAVTIEKLHSEIVEALEEFLSPEFTLGKGNISIEKMRFRGNIADVVTIENYDLITIYEVKTSATGRRNIRDAIAQLLDYALHAGKLRIKRLVIVSPSKLKPFEIEFLNGIKTKVAFQITYYQYCDSKSPKFMEFSSKVV